MLPYTAYLRVYEPLEAFPERERTWWRAYASSKARPRRVQALQAEQEESLRALIVRADEGPSLVHESQNAYLRRFHGKTYICPWQRRLRSWTAFSAAQGLSVEVTGRQHIRESTWHVPRQWFVPFLREERWISLERPRTLTYVTTMARARDRLGRAQAVRERTSALPFGDVRGLARALSRFHPESLVELDYGGLVHLLDDAALEADDSVGETAVALVAWERDEIELAVAMRLRLKERWRAIRAIETAN
ncbi:hypothetical protein [Actinocorallia longicatena]|uniref:DUF8083 domain-containing protein n=1 Tax=Actinocorallia longicatena TaxID=111803 RepID=A0ABP6QF58_9ACTN